jgi:phosphoglucomutase
MIEKLKEKLKKKQSEVLELQNQIEKEENKEYHGLIGRYFRLSTTCYFRVDKIDYVDENHVHVNGLKLFFDNNEFRIEIDGTESIYKFTKPTEISRDDFLNYIQSDIDMIKLKINNLV